MEMFYPGVGLGVLIGGVAGFVTLVLRAGSVSKAMWGLSVAAKATRDAAMKAKINALVGTTAASTPSIPSTPLAPPPPPKPSGESLRLLALLQAEARLVDFLMEDISAASDAQIGQGVREVHAKAAKALKQYLTLTTVMSGTEGDRVTVATGYDPSAIRVTGQVTGQAPYSGELQHAGWRVLELKLPGTASGQDLFVIQPAEVQV